MVWKNPVNGRGALYIASHAYAVEGMEPKAGEKLIEELTEAATAPGTTYEHKWKNGDVVMWDNRATMHRGRPWPAQRGALHGAHHDLGACGRRRRDDAAIAAAGGGVTASAASRSSSLFLCELHAEPLAEHAMPP
jgi:hypothetical protein